MEKIYINGKKMKRVEIGWRAGYLLPYFPYKEEDGTEIYRLLERIFYKKDGHFYIEAEEEQKK